jgi:hypothetical protein
MSQRLATLKESLDVLKETPELLVSFKTPFNKDELEMPELKIFLQGQDGKISDVPITITDVFPTFTVQDILRKLWTQVGKNEWLPEYTFLGIPNEDASKYEAVKGTWYFPFSQNLQDIFILPNPIQHLAENTPFKEFVAENGEKQPMNFKMRDRSTIETLFLKSNRGGFPVIHAFCLSYLQRLYPNPTPYSSRTWYGIFYPYFPTIEETGPFEATPKQLEDAASAKKYITLKVQEAKKAEQLISEPYPGIRITSINHIQFEYNRPEKFSGCDISFYGTQVTENIPFLRYIPANGQTMTKLYRPNALTLPFINDCDLLRDWTEVNLPHNASELVVGKFAITTRDPAYYGTLRLFEDGRADITLQPPKNVRALDFPKELKSEPLVELIRSGLEGIVPDIDSARFVQATVNFGIHKEKGERKYSKGRKYTTEISRQIFKERLAHFKTIFQEISPTEEEKGSQIMIRYKGVDNFDSEDKIEAYCTFQATKKLLEGDTINEDLVTNVSREFGLSMDESRYRVAKWILKKAEMTVMDSKDAAAAFNPGTDIAIYLQHPDYIFHVYRVESLESFERIVALMNIIIGAPEEFFAANKASAVPEFVAKEESPVESVGESVELSNSPADKPDVFDFDDAEADETDQAALASSLPAQASKKSVVERLNEMKAVVAEPEEDEEQRSIVPYKFFINRLKQLDKTLFEFKTTSTADKPYSILCQANVTVQPLVMNEREYERMKSIYKEDINPENPKENPKMAFIEYGGDNLEEQIKQSKAVENVKNRFTVVKYGSSVENKNYYLCARYFCLNDYVVILEEEFKEEGSFRGREKKANQCPFCGGKVIPHEHIKQNIPPVKGETVLERRAKPKSDGKIPELIQFLGEGKHPQGLNLPCCYTKEPKGKELARLTSLSKKTAKKKAADSDDDDEEEDEDELSIKRVIEFDALRAKVSQLYIKDSSKFPLSSGTFGICGPALDDYFSQDSQDLVERVAIQQRLKPTGEGFLRVGVQNSSLDLTTSLFSALAPILNQRSWKEVGEYIKNQIQPRAFINLNFGNLLLEFYDMAINNPIPEKKITSQAISTWASEYLKADIVENEVELRRFYMAYRRFTRYLTNSSEIKQLRHIYHALAEPGLITTNGLTLIVLEYKGNPGSQDFEINARCPSLGFDISRYDRNDIVFITRDSKGFWEPLAYVQKQLIGPTKIVKQEAIYKFTINQLGTINSSAVRERINEFIKQCSSSYRGYYTSQSHIDSRLLIPISVALKSLGATGLVRDSYNHLVALTISASKDGFGEVVVPIADDGYIAHKDKDLRIYVSWNSIDNNLASAKDVYTIYNTIVKRKLLPFSKQYTLIDFLKEPDNKIRGFRIGLSGSEEEYPPIVLPCKETDLAELAGINVPITEQAKISFPFKEESKYILTENVTEEESYTDPESLVQKEQVEELYQTFRLTFANWLVTNEYRAEFRGDLKRIIDPKFMLPLYEQRRRLEILIGPILAKWLYADPEPFDIIPKLRRVNCLELSEGSCEGSCKWVSEDQTCRLHLPKKPEKDIVHMFILRLIDELIRLPVYANELLTNKVQKIQVPKKAMQIDDQYYLPNNSPELTELFQQMCSKKEKITEEPKFYEEFGVDPDEVVYSKTYEDIGKLVELPAQFVTYLNLAAKKSLRLLVVDSADSLDKTLKLTEVFPNIDLEEFNKTRTKNQFSEANLNYISGAIRLPVIQFMINPSNPALKLLAANYGSKPYRQGVVVFLPDAPQGPGFVVSADQRKPQIPIDILEGVLKDMALKAVPLRGTLPLEKAVPLAKAAPLAPTQPKRKVVLAPEPTQARRKVVLAPEQEPEQEPAPTQAKRKVVLVPNDEE